MAFRLGRTGHRDNETRAEDLRLGAHLEKAKNFCATRNDVSTLRKHNRNVLAPLHQLFERQALGPRRGLNSYC